MRYLQNGQIVQKVNLMEAFRSSIVTKLRFASRVILIAVLAIKSTDAKASFVVLADANDLVSRSSRML
jgi:hypothetical protein